MPSRRPRAVPSPQEWERLSPTEQHSLLREADPHVEAAYHALMKQKYFSLVHPSGLFPLLRPVKAALRRPRVRARHRR